MSVVMNQQVMRLAGVLQLQERARTAPPEELPFVIVNETMQVAGYEQAALWDARSGRIAALSGAARPEPGAPYVAFLERLCRRIVRTDDAATVHEPSPEGLESEWTEFLPPHVVSCPLADRGRVVALVLLARQDPWAAPEAQLLTALSGAYAQSWELARARRLPVAPANRRRLRRWGGAAAILGVLALGAVPVSSTSIAPAEVAAATPLFIRAPFAGVVDSIAVAPNAEVRSGQVLVRLDRRQLEMQQSVAAKSVEVADAQYRQATQEAIGDPRIREQLAVLRSKLDEARADQEYRRNLLARADIPAPADGVAVFNDPGEWIGRPVETGERIMLVAPPTSARIDIELPTSDTVTLKEGARVVFFDNINPDRPVEGHLVFASYASSLSAAGVLAYVGRADLEPGTALRLGLKGVAKIYGPPRPLALWLFRRPVNWLRELLA